MSPARWNFVFDRTSLIRAARFRPELKNVVDQINGIADIDGPVAVSVTANIGGSVIHRGGRNDVYYDQNRC